MAAAARAFPLFGLILLAPASAHAAASFMGLGDLPGGMFRSSAGAISADGSVVVGYSFSGSGFEAFRWTLGGGMVGNLGSGSSDAQDVSADGSVVVGQSFPGPQAYRWTSDGGMVGLGDLTGGHFGSISYGVSADGSVVVGLGTSGSGTEAFRWTPGGGMVGLGDLAGGSFDSQANSVSADGSVIVGRGTSASGSDAFRWTSDGGMVGLGPSTSWALGVSGDGSVIVGNASGRAFIWDATHGVRTLSDVLVNDYGLDLTGWTLLREAVDISADGTIIIGDGIHAGNQEAWIAVVPEPSTALLFGAGLAALALRRGVRARGEIGRIHSH